MAKLKCKDFEGFGVRGRSGKNGRGARWRYLVAVSKQKEPFVKIKDRPEFGSKPKPMTCAPDQTVREAARRMSQRNYGAIVVVDDDQKVLGLMTERDIMSRLVAGDLDPDATRVADIMTSEVRVAREDDKLVDWLRIMSNERFRRLPIVDENGRLKSIMTQGDFVSYTWPDLVNQAVTLTKSTVGGSYQIFLILAAVLAYTLLMGAALSYAF